ncbi:MAG: NYN domain-containing protein [Anaerolineaceae bacterium]|nr:NYN domain-containing protein [Anaerolineaceae bacterium]
MDRVITYIDGFNLYFGLKSSRWQRYYWLNLQLLSQNLLKPGQQLIYTKYFTSRIANPTDKRIRQTVYLEALGTLPHFSITYGKYQHNLHTCPKCGNVEIIPSEKMTDVNIAVELLGDAYENKFDTALLISADSDLTTPVQKVRQLSSKKRVISVFPPNRVSKNLEKVAVAAFQLGRATISKSLFPDEVRKADGYILKRPEKWQ